VNEDEADPTRGIDDSIRQPGDESEYDCPCCGDPLTEDEELDPESGLCARCAGRDEP
jgi:hypothetical protein